jgi:2-oxoglutarate ferredoxin oxidoreductase subunit alpha
MDLTMIVGGKAGAGIKEAGRLICSALTELGYYVFMYVDYPSLIRGGHNFVSIRLADFPINSVHKKADIIIATDKRSVKEHLEDAKDDTLWIINEVTDKDMIPKAREIIVMPFKEVAPSFFKSTSVFGGVLKLLNIDYEVGLPFVRKLKEPDKNEAIYKDAYEAGVVKFDVKPSGEKKGELVSGNDAVANGAVDGGLDIYFAYPMTPSSSVLHTLAAKKDQLGIKVIHPENEIAVINMAIGAAYAGKRSMVGTSGGGFALMVEALSLAGMTETPVVIYEAQRPGPSTGLPTYSAQSDLLFAIFAGHGDFGKVVIGVSDAEDSYSLTKEALNLAWEYQVPVIVLSDKNAAENYYISSCNEICSRIKDIRPPKMYEGDPKLYKRYQNVEDGISPLLFPGTKDAVVKANSYEHNEAGITTEDAHITKLMQDKRLRKYQKLKNDILNTKKTYEVFGNKDSDVCLISWGSNKHVLKEVANALNIKFVHVIYLEPFPEEDVKKEVSGKKLIAVECSATKQFERLLHMYGIRPDVNINKYDGRPFFEDEALELVKSYIN